MFIIDKVLRITLGFLILIIFGLINPTWLCFLGLIPLISGVSEFCPIYFLMGKYKKEGKKENKKKLKKSNQNKLFNDEPIFN